MGDDPDRLGGGVGVCPFTNASQNFAFRSLLTFMPDSLRRPATAAPHGGWPF